MELVGKDNTGDRQEAVTWKLCMQSSGGSLEPLDNQGGLWKLLP